jgi:uncharacterized damage-inducible protein DinB
MLDRDALRELFDYTDFTWSVWSRALRGMPPEQFTQAVPGSGWPAMRNVLFHIAAAWDEFFVNRFAGELEVIEVDDLTWPQLDAQRRKVRALMRRLLDESSDEELRTEVASSAGGVDMTTGDLLTHLLLHDLRHHGDITTLLHQLDAQPTLSDYAVYLWFKQREQSRG